VVELGRMNGNIISVKSWLARDGWRKVRGHWTRNKRRAA
jgi:hypothetical protein